ncbi:MAG: hypothetical protein K0U93_27955 [Gammaproteobacteria bacterium]|nr:hypothetical protein [Gammaproteobacteria bacterium]
MFINSCFAANNQNEYYVDRYEQSVSIAFLHEYILVNYRRIYARVLAIGVNHFNRATIIANLLRAGTPTDPSEAVEEGELIANALAELPANRAYGLIARLSAARINNRRTRAVIKRYLARRPDVEFDAVKYRSKFKAAVAHAHVRMPGEFGPFLFAMKGHSQFKTSLFENFRQAHYTQQAVYKLPFTVAESMAVRHGIARDVFLKKIEPKMTATEKLRFQNAAARTKGAALSFDLRRAPLTRLAIYVLSLPSQERHDRAQELDEALRTSAQRALHRAPLALGRVATVLDRSRSTWGTREKRRRTLALALASSYFLRAASETYRPFWAPAPGPLAFEHLVEAGGQTPIAQSLIDALEWQPSLIVILSDGYENDPPMACASVVDAYREKLAGVTPIEIVHANPVFDANHFSPHSLCAQIPTVGVRDAEDLATMLGFVRYASGAASLSELNRYLESRVAIMKERHGS